MIMNFVARGLYLIDVSPPRRAGPFEVLRVVERDTARVPSGRLGRGAGVSALSAMLSASLSRASLALGSLDCSLAASRRDRVLTRRA